MPRPPPPAAALTSTGIGIRRGSTDRRDLRDLESVRSAHPPRSPPAWPPTLSPSSADLVGGRPDPQQPGVDHALGERRRSRRGTRSRGGPPSHRCRAQLDDRVAAQVRLGRRRAAERDGDVDRVDVERVAVGFGVDADRGDAQPVRSPGDPARDLAPVRDQELGDRAGMAGGAVRLISASRRRTRWRPAPRCCGPPTAPGPAPFGSRRDG